MKTHLIDDYSRYDKLRQRLAEIISEVSNVAGELTMTSRKASLEELSTKVRNDTFKIQVVGTFKNGKSTFINSLLGEDVLPAYSLPCTAVINEIKYGEEKKATLHFRNPLPESLPASTPEKVLEHIRTHQAAGDIPPMDVPYDELEDYVVIPMDCMDVSQMLLETPYHKVEVFWPLELLRNGVEIIDSPGLNEHATRTRVTMEYLTKADAILFVFNAQALCAEAEMDFLETNLVAQGFTDVFCIVNRIDLIPARERSRVEAYARMRLEKFSTNEISFISALNALTAKQESHADLYEASGLKKFEDYLSRFLTREKGKAKLARPAREIKRIINDEAQEHIIPRLRGMLDSSLQEVTTRYQKAKPQLEALRAEKKVLIHQMALDIERAKHDFSRAALKYWTDLIDKIPVWVAAKQIDLSWHKQFSKKELQRITKEITDHVFTQMNRDQTQWLNAVYQPLLQEKASAIFSSVEKDMGKLLDTIERVQVELSGQSGYKGSDVPVWERLVGIGGGLLIGDPGIAASGGLHGLSKEMLYTALAETAAGILLAILGLLNPVTIFAVIGAAIAVNTSNGASKAVTSIKDEITKEFQNQLSKDAQELAQALVDSALAQLTARVNTASTAIDKEIDDAEKRVQDIIEELDQGRARIEARKQNISACETRLRELNGKLDDLISELLA